MPDDLLPTDLVFEQENPDFSSSGLKFRSIFRAHKLALLHRDLVLRVLGGLTPALMEQIDARLQIALGLRNTSDL